MARRVEGGLSQRGKSGCVLATPPYLLPDLPRYEELQPPAPPTLNPTMMDAYPLKLWVQTVSSHKLFLSGV